MSKHCQPTKPWVAHGSASRDRALKTFVFGLAWQKGIVFFDEKMSLAIVTCSHTFVFFIKFFLCKCCQAISIVRAWMLVSWTTTTIAGRRHYVKLRGHYHYASRSFSPLADGKRHIMEAFIPLTDWPTSDQTVSTLTIAMLKLIKKILYKEINMTTSAKNFITLAELFHCFPIYRNRHCSVR